MKPSERMLADLSKAEREGFKGVYDGLTTLIGTREINLPKWDTLASCVKIDFINQFCEWPPTFWEGVLYSTMAHQHDHDAQTYVSAHLWCDPGNHAFCAGTAGSQSRQMTQVNEEGQPVQVQYDCCPEHAFQPTVKTQAEISPVYGVSYRDPNSAPGLE